MRHRLLTLVGAWLVAFGLVVQARAPLPDAAKDKTEDLPTPYAKALARISGKMDAVKDRLGKGSGGGKTQQLQQEVLIRLDVMLEALEDQQKAKFSNQRASLIAELRMVRAMQNRVNVRTKLFGDPGEVVPPPETAKDPKERAA